MGARSTTILAALVGVGIPGCQCKDVCQDPYDPFQFCIENKTCTVTSAQRTECRGGTLDCDLSNPSPGDTLTIPVGAMWPTLGSRDDLWIPVCNCPSPRDAGDGGGTACDGSLTVLYDGLRATGCSCPSDGPIVCSDIPHSVKVISLTFAEGASDLSLEFHDSECEATHRICER